MNVEKVKRGVIYIKLCLGRGQTYLSDFKNVFLFAMGFKIFGLSTFQGFALGALGIIGFVIIGFLDLHWGIWKKEQEISTEEINPYFEKLLERLKSIECKVGK